MSRYTRRVCGKCGVEEPTYITTAWCPREGYHQWIEGEEAERRKRIAERLPRLRELGKQLRELARTGDVVDLTTSAIAEAIELLTDECEAVRVTAKGKQP
jgi:hypothetical protein